jgi:hypothetical protein
MAELACSKLRVIRNSAQRRRSNRIGSTILERRDGSDRKRIWIDCGWHLFCHHRDRERARHKAHHQIYANQQFAQIRRLSARAYSLSVEKFLKQRAVNVSLPDNYTLPNWYDPQGNLRTFACRTTRVSPFRMLVDVPVVGFDAESGLKRRPRNCAGGEGLGMISDKKTPSLALVNAPVRIILKRCTD